MTETLGISNLLHSRAAIHGDPNHSFSQELYPALLILPLPSVSPKLLFKSITWPNPSANPTNFGDNMSFDNNDNPNPDSYLRNSLLVLNPVTGSS